MHPEPQETWVCPQRPDPPAPVIRFPNLKIKLLVKDPDRRKAGEPPIVVEAPPALANPDMSQVIFDMVDSLGSEHEIEMKVSGRKKIVDIMLGWVSEYSVHPKANQYPPNTQLVLRRNRHLANPPPVEDNPAEENEIAQTLPLWDIEYFHLRHMIDPDDGKPDGAYEMDPEFLTPGELWELIFIANELGMDKFMIHLRKVYHLAYICGHLPEEIQSYERIDRYPRDADYWPNAFTRITEREADTGSSNTPKL